MAVGGLIVIVDLVISWILSRGSSAFACFKFWTGTTRAISSGTAFAQLLLLVVLVFLTEWTD